MARRPVEHRGYFQSGKGKVDLLGCSHCTASIPVPPRGSGASTMQVHRCGKCDRTICRRCAEVMARTLRCETWDQKFAAYERREALLKSI